MTTRPVHPAAAPDTDAPPAAIEIRSLVLRYGRHVAVDGLSLTVQPGELFGFLGPNGAGKTSTIRALIGLLRPAAGSIRVAGLDLPRQWARVKPLCGYVPDTENHYEDFTGRQNLRLYARLYGVDAAAAERLLGVLELAEAADVKVAGYSKGMKKKLLLARELLHRPRVLFCDEPTANLDRHSVALVRRLLREQAAAGMTVFLTTHDMDEVEELCDRVAILSRGRLLDCATPTAFITRHAERRVDVQFDRDGVQLRETHDMDDPDGRRRMARILETERMVRLHSREFRFEDVFRKLTGEDYR